MQRWEATYLSDDDDVRPPVLDGGAVERPLDARHALVDGRLVELRAHALARLDRAQLLDRARPVRVREQCTREDACAGTDPGREAETHRERTERGRYGCTPTLLH